MLFKTTVIAVAALIATVSASITIPAGSGGCAVEQDQGNVRIYYQAADTSIHEISSFGIPGSGAGYADNLLIPAGVAKQDTPLACFIFSNSLSEIHLYYVGSDLNSKHLREYVYTSSAGWKDGSLNSQGWTVGYGASLLYTIMAPGTTASGSYRVGFPCDGYPSPLCEGVHTTSGWTWNPY